MLRLMPNQFDIHPCRTDEHSLPFVGQHPRVGHVAVQTGGEDQHHHAHFMATHTELFTTQSVPELVQYFDRGM